MNQDGVRKPIRLQQEDLISSLPERIGNVRLDYSHYPGKDLYSDGAVEDELLGIVKNASKVEYQELIEEKNSWPILYHLSPLRANIVDWLPITKEHKVLEIGSGCGAITDKLAQKAGEVTCVDLSARRSHINAWRNQDQDNITIHVGNFKDIEPELPADYDFVCLIGVFEYGASYIPTKTPYEDFLKIMMRHVKKDGHLVIAIENKLGLKYFAGCKEDHLGTWFSGLEGYPDGGSARTFSRKGLCRILESCGVSDYSFYYPYPDYKFPTVIYSDRRLPVVGELTDNIRNFDRDRLLTFNEKYVYDGLIEDGSFPDFSNSFMVITGKMPETTYVKYSNDRAESYQLCTALLETEKGREIRKYPLTEQAKEHVLGMDLACRLLKKRYEGSDLKINTCTLPADGSYASFAFEEGVTLEELMDKALFQGDTEEFERLFDRYLQFISYGEESGVTDYDLIFANILVKDDQFTVIDYEWTMEETISTKEIAFRAIYCYILEEERRNKLNLDRIMDKLHVTQQEAEEYRSREEVFQKKVTGKHKSMGEIRAGIGTYCLDVKKLAKEHLQKILDQRIQVYRDLGEGFSEQQSEYLPDVYTDEYTIEVDIPFDGNVRALRVDPADRSCIVRIEEVLLNGGRIQLNDKNFATNGRKVKDQTWVFATMDPGMTFSVLEMPVTGENTMHLRMKLSPVAMDMAEDVMNGCKHLFRKG